MKEQRYPVYDNVAKGYNAGWEKIDERIPAILGSRATRIKVAVVIATTM
jgi:hypothetical protein